MVTKNVKLLFLLLLNFLIFFMSFKWHDILLKRYALSYSIIFLTVLLVIILRYQFIFCKGYMCVMVIGYVVTILSAFLSNLIINPFAISSLIKFFDYKVFLWMLIYYFLIGGWFVFLINKCFIALWNSMIDKYNN